MALFVWLIHVFLFTGLARTTDITTSIPKTTSGNAVLNTTSIANNTWSPTGPQILWVDGFVCEFAEVKCKQRRRKDEEACYLLVIRVLDAKEDATFDGVHPKLDGSPKIAGAFYTRSIILWSPHRNRPVTKDAKLVAINGRLDLIEADGNLVWTSNTTCATSLNLGDNGNMVLRDVTGKQVWQSFHSPTDTLLPSQRLGIGNKVVSLRGDMDYSEGSFYAQVESHQVGLYDNRFSSPQIYAVWRPRRNTSIQYMQHDGKKVLGVYDQMNNPIEKAGIPKHPHLSLALNTMGGFELRSGRESLHREPKCFVRNRVAGLNCSVAACGENGICRNDPAPRCSCPRGDTYGFVPVDTKDRQKGCRTDYREKTSSFDFLELTGVDHISNMFLQGQHGLTLEECKDRCLQDMSCKAAFYRFENTSSVCHHADVPLLLGDESLNVTALLKVHHKDHRPRWVLPVIVVMAATTGLIIMSGIFLVIFFWMRRRKAENDQMKQTTNLPKHYRYLELYKATKGFNHKLGVGGFGIVYKGVIADGTCIAVKRLECARQGQKQFEAEVRALGSLSHRNLVKLQGFGMSWKRHYYLVYEFMPNSSLDKWLFTDKAHVLDWKRRFGIAMDVARGLTYLHEGCQAVVLHRDIKPQNILLDASFRAKICDFGLARLMDPDVKSIVATKLGGTPGYMPPELLNASISEKSDVYSFGIVLLELVSGQKIVSAPSGMSVHSSLCSKAFSQAGFGTLAGLIDETMILTSYDIPQVQRVIQVGLDCVQQDPCIRPSMSTASKMLEEMEI